MVKKTLSKNGVEKVMKKMAKEIVDLEFAEEDNAITMNQFLEIRQYFDKNLVMGIELERNMGSRNAGTGTVARELGNAGQFNNNRLDTANQYKKATGNKYNVAMVKGDGSVTNGVEVIFGGCNESFLWVKNKLEEIEKVLDRLGAVNFCPTSSNHISFITLQDKLLNPTIIKNIFNLTRAFSPALYWLGAGDHNNIHRGSNYCPPKFGITPIGKTASSFVGSVSKYSQCNCGKTATISVAGKEFLSGLYVEFRHVDGIRVPTALTINGFVLRALIYKALSLSRKGVLKVESLTDWARTKQVVGNLHARNVDDDDIQFFRAQAKDLIDFLMPELKSMCPEYIGTIYELASKPCYVRGRSWKAVEQQIKVKARKVNLSENEENFLNIVFDGTIKGKTLGEWKKKTARKVNVSERMIEYMMKSIAEKLGTKLVFDKEIKGVRVD